MGVVKVNAGDQNGDREGWGGERMNGYQSTKVIERRGGGGGG